MDEKDEQGEVITRTTVDIEVAPLTEAIVTAAKHIATGLVLLGVCIYLGFVCSVPLPS